MERYYSRRLNKDTMFLPNFCDTRETQLAISIRIKDLKFREDERKAWHPATDIYFQENVWFDRAVATGRT